jgi:hypothetical protein
MKNTTTKSRVRLSLMQRLMLDFFHSRSNKAAKILTPVIVIELGDMDRAEARQATMKEGFILLFVPARRLRTLHAPISMHRIVAQHSVPGVIYYS